MERMDASSSLFQDQFPAGGVCLPPPKTEPTGESSVMHQSSRTYLSTSACRWHPRRHSTSGFLFAVFPGQEPQSKELFFPSQHQAQTTRRRKRGRERERKTVEEARGETTETGRQGEHGSEAHKCDYNGDFTGSLARNDRFCNRWNRVGIPLKCDYNGDLAGSLARNDRFCVRWSQSEFALYNTKRFTPVAQRARWGRTF